MSTATTEAPTTIATDVSFDMVLTRDGKVEVVGSPWRVVPGSDVPASVRSAAEAVVLATFDSEAAEAALDQAHVDDMPPAIGAHRKHLREEATERLMLANVNFESAVCRHHRWTCVVVLDHGVWLTEPNRGRPEVVVEPLSGKHSCVMCRGLGREKAPLDHPTAPMGAVVPCRLCDGSGVRSHKIPTWIVEGLAKRAFNKAADVAATF